MEFSRKNNFIALLIVFSPFLLYFSFIFANKYQYLAHKVYSKNFNYKTASVNTALDSVNLKGLPKQLENPPDILRGINVTGWSAGSKNYFTYLNELLKKTQINAIVIDVKDSSGIVSYKTQALTAKKYKAYRAEIPNINKLINELHNKGVYVIGRIVVFEDPVLAKNRPDLAIYDTSKTKDTSKPVLWTDDKGMLWLDPAAQEVFDYNIAIAKDALAHGFDEINFDYVRFPTGGQKNTMGFPIFNQKIPKSFIVKNFFKKLRDSLPDAKISIDIFGQTTTNTDDMGIGQILEDAFDYFDYVCPMLYPSHYANGFMGYKNPAMHPYEVIKYSIDTALARQKVYSKIYSKSNSKMAKIRPWLQDFNIGATYNADMVRQEIKAVIDSAGENFNGFLLWNPSNIYTSEAIIKEDIILK